MSTAGSIGRLMEAGRQRNPLNERGRNTVYQVLMPFRKLLIWEWCVGSWLASWPRRTRPPNGRAHCEGVHSLLDTPVIPLQPASL